MFWRQTLKTRCFVYSYYYGHSVLQCFFNQLYKQTGTTFTKCLTNFCFFRKKKIIGNWQKTFETGRSGATVIAYNTITAFKFPDKDQVYLTCNIEVRQKKKKEEYYKNKSPRIHTNLPTLLLTLMVGWLVFMNSLNKMDGNRGIHYLF